MRAPRRASRRCSGRAPISSRSPVPDARPETAAAIAAVEAALAIVHAREGADLVRAKGHRDIVTAADLAAEDAIRAVLGARTPAIPVVGEERGGELSAGSASWLVDPICGTQNFAADLPLYTVNVALVEHGRVTAAVVGDGATSRTYVAERGRGAYDLATAKALRVSTRSALVALEAGKAEGDPRFWRVLQRVAQADEWGLRVLGTSLSFAYVATGRLAAALDFGVDDVLHLAAGCLLAEEAGATVTELDGRPWGLKSRTFLAAATPELHRSLRRLVGT